MRLVDLPIPPRPAVFSPMGAPPGVAVDFGALKQPNGQPWYLTREIIKPRVVIAHTNAASVEASLVSSINFGNSAASKTKPHYHLAWPNCTKVVPSNRRAIANATEDWYQAQTGEVDCSFWTLSIESADTGTLDDPSISDFLQQSKFGAIPVRHDEVLARIYAYESIVWNIPIELPAKWNGTGVAAHTYPFPHPAYTTAEGKTCPGPKKIATIVNEVIPRARQIRAAWLGEGDTVALIHFKLSDGPTLYSSVEGSYFATRIEGRQALARGLDFTKPFPVLSATEAAKYVFASGFTDESVR